MKILEKIQKGETTFFQFIRFGLVGGVNTFVDLLTVYVLIFITGVGTEGAIYSLYKGIGFMVAATNSYFLNKIWVFKKKETSKKAFELGSFFVFTVGGALINIGVASLAVNYVIPMLGLEFLSGKVGPLVGGLCGTAAGLIWNFVMYKFIVFKGENKAI